MVMVHHGLVANEPNPRFGGQDAAQFTSPSPSPRESWRAWWQVVPPIDIVQVRGISGHVAECTTMVYVGIRMMRMVFASIASLPVIFMSTPIYMRPSNISASFIQAFIYSKERGKRGGVVNLAGSTPIRIDSYGVS